MDDRRRVLAGLRLASRKLKVGANICPGHAEVVEAIHYIEGRPPVKNDELDRLEAVAADALKQLPELTVGANGKLFDMEEPAHGSELADAEKVWLAREMNPDTLIEALGNVRIHLATLHAALEKEPRRGAAADNK